MLELIQSLKYNLLHVGHARLDSSWDYNNVISPFTRLFYVTKGTAVVYHSNKEFRLKPGHMYIIPNYVYNRYKCEEFHEQYYISFFDEIRTGLSVFNLRNFNYEVKASLFDETLFKRLLACYPKRQVVNNNPKAYVKHLTDFLQANEQDAKQRTDKFIETQGILAILLSRFVQNTNPLGKSTVNKRDINQILIYIAKNLHRQLTVSELAIESNLSVDHFSRLFKKQMNMLPNKYIRSRRIQRAQLLLLTTNHTIVQVAQMIGFESYAHFSRVFKKEVGKSPSSFRKEKWTL